MKNIRTYLHHIKEQAETPSLAWLHDNPDAWVVFYLENFQAVGLIGVYSSKEDADQAYDAALDEEYGHEIEMGLEQWFDNLKEEGDSSFDGYDSMKDYAKDHPDEYKGWWAEQRSDISDKKSYEREYTIHQFRELPELIEESHVDYEPLLVLIEENPDMIHDPNVAKYFSRKIKTKRLFGI
jgi:hypothetical protein